MNLRTTVPAITGVITTLGSVAIPVTGFFFAGWSFATVMVVYFLENIIRLIATGIRIGFLAPADGLPSTIPLNNPTVKPVRHKTRSAASAEQPADEATPQAKYKTQTRKAYLEDYMFSGLPITIGPGVFMVCIFLIYQVPLNGTSILFSMINIFIFQVVALLADLLYLRNIPLERFDLWRKQNFRRDFLFMLICTLGVLCSFLFEAVGFLFPFILLKTLSDINGLRKDVQGFLQARA